MKVWRRILACIAVFAMVSVVLGPGVVSASVLPEIEYGYVRDNLGNAIANAKVTDLNTEVYTYSNAQGFWNIIISSGYTHYVKAEKASYNTATITISISRTTGEGIGNFALIQNYYSWQPAYSPSTGFATYSQNVAGLATNTWYVYPTDVSASGTMTEHIDTYGGGLGAAQTYSQFGEWIGQWTPGHTDYATVTFNWHLKVEAFASCTIPNPFGGADSQMYIKLHVNIYDVTSQAWKVDGDQVLTAVSVDNYLGIGDYGLHGDHYYTQVVNNCYLVSGHQYQFYVYIETHTFISGWGLGVGHSMIDLAPDNGDGRSGWMTSVNVSI